MKDICLPFTGIPDNNTAEVIIKMAPSDITMHYRIESFDLKLANNAEGRIQILREQIKKYDPRWELIQIMDTNERQSCVHVLYRERK